MITQSESGLSEAAYNAMLTATDPAFKVEIQQYNLSLSEKSGGGSTGPVSTLTTSSSSSMLVRAWVYDGTVYAEALANEDSGDQSWSSQSFNPSSLSNSAGCSVIVSDTTIRVFYFADGAIRYRESFGGAAFGSEQTVGSAGTVVGLAAVSLTRVHYIELTSKRNYRLCAYEAVGGWDKTESNVYWPFRPTSFDAVNASPTDDEATSDTDVIALSTDFPPIISVKAEGTTLVKDVERVQGIAILRYQNGRWSDHYSFDVVDNMQTHPSRYGVRLSKYSDWIFMTYMRTDGFGTYTTTTIATTRSKDGIAWEIPYLLTDNLDGPCCLEKMGKYAYLLDAVGTYRSLSSAYTGDARNTYDVSEYVMDVAVRAVEVTEVQITLSNQAGILDATSPFGDDAVLQVILDLGFTVDGTDQYLQVLLADVEIVSTTKTVPQQNTVIVGRDSLGRLTSFSSDYSQEWETQSIGGDDFEGVVADTIYSGMGHTAPIIGSWQTEDNILSLESSEHPGVAFNTYCFDAWNGGAQVGIKVSDSDTEDYAGICFRSFDRENMWYAIYEADSDNILLVKRHQNTETTVASYEDIGWSRDTWYYIKVAFRYSRILVYTSTDGLEWTERIEHEPYGMNTPTWTFSSLPGMMSGRMGYTGYGYTESEGGGGGPGPDPPPPPDPPPDPPPPDPPPLGQTAVLGTVGQRQPGDSIFDPLPPGGGIVYGVWGEWGWTEYNTGFPFTPVIESLDNLGSDQRGLVCIARTGGDGDPYYTPEVWLCEDITAGEPWELILSNDSAKSIIPAHVYDCNLAQVISFMHGGEEHIYVAVRYSSNESYSPLDQGWHTRMLHTSDRGDLWNSTGTPRREIYGEISASLQITAIGDYIDDQTSYPGTGCMVYDDVDSYLYMIGALPPSSVAKCYRVLVEPTTGIVLFTTPLTIGYSYTPLVAGGNALLDPERTAFPDKEAYPPLTIAMTPDWDTDEDDRWVWHAGLERTYVTELDLKVPSIYEGPYATMGEGWEVGARRGQMATLANDALAYIKMNSTTGKSLLRVSPTHNAGYWSFVGNLPGSGGFKVAGSGCEKGGSIIDGDHPYRTILANPDDGDSCMVFRTYLKTDGNSGEAHDSDDVDHIARVTYNIHGVENRYYNPYGGNPTYVDVHDDCDWEDANSSALYYMGVGGVACSVNVVTDE